MLNTIRVKSLNISGSHKKKISQFCVHSLLQSSCNIRARLRVFAEYTMRCLTLRDTFVELMTNLLKLMLNGDEHIQTCYAPNLRLYLCSAPSPQNPSYR